MGFPQLRLDFESFIINQPSTDAIPAKATSGNIIVDAAKGSDVTLNTRCLTDVFSVSNPGGQAPPQICGNNNNEHSKVHIFFGEFWTF